jgi:hypothetical protein
MVSDLRLGNEPGEFDTKETDVIAVMTPPIEELKEGQEVVFVCPTAISFGLNMKVEEIVRGNMTLIVGFADTRSHARLREQRRFELYTIKAGSDGGDRALSNRADRFNGANTLSFEDDPTALLRVVADGDGAESPHSSGSSGAA